MLLPSALSCDGSRAIPSSPGMLLSSNPRRATRIPQDRPSFALFPPSQAGSRESRYENPILASIGSRTSAVEGIFTTCKKLHQILSLEPSRSASVSSSVTSATTQTHHAFNLAISSPTIQPDAPSTPSRQNRTTKGVSTTQNAVGRLAVPTVVTEPQTPTKRALNVMKIPKTPMRRNKRRRTEDSGDDDGFYKFPVQSPKRPRLSVVPASEMSRSIVAEDASTGFNRRCRQLRTNTAVAATSSKTSTSLTPSALQMTLYQPSSLQVEDQHREMVPAVSDSDTSRNWTHAEDRLLVELVLQKLRLSTRDWADCARSLGRDPLTVGNRWDLIVGNLMGGARDSRIAGGVERRKRLEHSESSSKSRI
ncbi:hypothetical protein BDZ91DRAFT_301434 [Kalaharituber pfeilii]|nr:hypothetical protein BDZ91DRAFT_301434 [Kalaharituber pfeilii]